MTAVILVEMPRQLALESYYEVVNFWRADNTTPYAAIGRLCNPEVSRHAVKDIIERYRASGDPRPRRGVPRPRRKALTADDVQTLVGYVTENPFASLPTIRRETGIDASDSTLARRLRENGIRARRPARKIRLTVHNKSERLAFAERNREMNWDPVMFSDETSVTSAQDQLLKFVRRRQGQRYDAEFVRENQRSGRVSVQIWGSFTSKGLHAIFRVKDKLNSDIYKRRILAYHVVPWCQEDPARVFQEDNSPIHKAGHVKAYLQRSGVTVLAWPPASPDLTPIENFWSLLKREIGRVNLDGGSEATKKNQLWSIIKDTWDRLKEGDDAVRVRGVIDRYYARMPARLEEVRRSGGGYTRH